MGDRMDIDALLIGALYGELTPADEARLSAHLESHPADRSALADLAHTREAVRASRVFAVQVEPPQSVSALLMQEAARRLPRKESDGWFYRLTRAVMGRSMMAAIGAAAMFVLVVGVAGTLYLKRAPQYAAPSSHDEAAISSVGAAAPAADPSTAVTVTAGVTAGATAGETTGAPSPAVAAPPPPASVAPAGPSEGGPPSDLEQSGGLAAGSGAAPAPAAKPGAKIDGYRVGLEEAQLAIRDQRRAVETKEMAKAALDNNTATARARLEVASEPEPVPAKAKAQKKSAGVVVRTPERQPKDLDEDVASARPSDTSAVRRDEARSGDRPASDRAAGDKTAASAPAGGGFAAPPGNAAAGAPAQRQGPYQAPNQPSAQADVIASGRTVAPAPASPPPQASQAPTSRPASAQAPSTNRFASKADQTGKADQTAKDAKPSDDKAGEDAGLLAWARKQHDQVKTLVKSNNCLGAANVAVGIYGRAPAYYSANVATDRELKSCVVYLNRERDREDRNRAAKRVQSTDAPAAPALKK
jgi:hypothetical protein